MALTSSSFRFHERTSGQRGSLSRLLVLWHLLDLDAPTVAAVWTWSFARHFDKTCDSVTLAVLSMGTWLLYAADRLLDGWRSLESHRIRLRHKFHRRHASAFLLAGAGITGTLSWLILTKTSESLIHSYGLLFGITICYFFAVHLRPTAKSNWLPKELFVGAIFASATSLPTLLQFRELSWLAIAAALLFAGVCWLNCVAIERWEGGDHMSSERFHGFLGALGLGALLLTGFAHGQKVQAEGLFFSEFLSLAIIALLDRYHSRLEKLSLRVAVDLALLTPLLLLNVSR